MSTTVADDSHARSSTGRRNLVVRLFAVLAVAATAGLVALAVQGVDAASRITGGATSKVITDSAAPGYVAAVDPTPVHLVAVTDAEDRLSSFLLLVPDAGGGAGSVIWSLGELVVDVSGTKTSLADLYSDSGIDAARAELEKVLGFGSTDVQIAGPDQFADVARPTGTLTVNNPDPVNVLLKGKKVEQFAAGTIDVKPNEIGDYLTVRGADELPENRSTRVEALLTSLSEALVGGEADAPGSSSSDTTAPVTTGGGPDLATVVVEMGAEAPDFIVLPTERQSFKGSYLYSPDPEAIADQLEGVVRFPVSSFPGQRPRVRILNGTLDTTAANGVAADLAQVGGEVLLLGNAASLDAGATTVVYSSESFQEVADRIAEVLGVTAERTEISDAADIDVVLGADYQR